MPSLTVPRRGKNLVVCAYGDGEGWAGESSHCEDPTPTVGIAGYAAPTIICAHMGINVNGE